MRPNQLKEALRRSALAYAKEKGYEVDSSPKSAVIFNKLANAFYPQSFEAIRRNTDWSARVQKPHQTLSCRFEMQSSNSSDALLMNIFCHPKLVSWKGVENIFYSKSDIPKFGIKALVEKEGTNGDATEIDMAFGKYFVEAKLTEKDFTEKDVTEVQKYIGLNQHFHVDCLPTKNGRYQNYQIIRNLLASIQHERRHMLLCDERRPDLVRLYMETVCCLRDPQVRKRCRVVFWQEMHRACGRHLGLFLKLKYFL